MDAKRIQCDDRTTHLPVVWLIMSGVARKESDRPFVTPRWGSVKPSKTPEVEKQRASGNPGAPGPDRHDIGNHMHGGFRRTSELPSAESVSEFTRQKAPLFRRHPFQQISRRVIATPRLHERRRVSVDQRIARRRGGSQSGTGVYQRFAQDEHISGPGLQLPRQGPRP